MKNYRAQTPQSLALTEILQEFGKTSTPQGTLLAFLEVTYGNVIKCIAYEGNL